MIVPCRVGRRKAARRCVRDIAQLRVSCPNRSRVRVQARVGEPKVTREHAATRHVAHTRPLPWTERASGVATPEGDPMLTSLKKSWPLLVIAVIVYLALGWVNTQEWWRTAIQDPVGLGPLVMGYPTLNFTIGVIGAWRHGLSTPRSLVVALLSLVAWFAFFDGARQLGAIAVFVGLYTICGVFGEFGGFLLRRAQLAKRTSEN